MWVAGGVGVRQQGVKIGFESFDLPARQSLLGFEMLGFEREFYFQTRKCGLEIEFLGWCFYWLKPFHERYKVNQHVNFVMIGKTSIHFL